MSRENSVNLDKIDQKRSDYSVTDHLKTLERGLDVIKSFKQNPTLTISECSKITELSRPVVRRVLITLTNLGYVSLNKGRYSLTPKILSLGYSYFSSKSYWELTVPYLERLSEEIGESTSISVLDGTDIVYVVRVPVNKIMRHSLNVGTRLPAYVTSMGKVMLSHLPEEKLKQYFNSVQFQAYTEQTLISEKAIREELTIIKVQGWALSQDELEHGLLSIAAPIKDTKGKVIAAINCSTHTGRNNAGTVRKQYLPLLLETAEAISKNFDFEIL